MREGLTYEKLRKIWSWLKSQPPADYSVFLTESEMRERGYSDSQIERMKQSKELEVPEDKEKWETWYLNFVGKLSRKQ